MRITAEPVITHHLPGYSFVETLYQGTLTTVYRAIEIENQQSVIIKVLDQEYPSFSNLVQFRNQYTVAKNLPIPGIIHPFYLEPWGNSYALVMEDINGIDLKQYVQQYPLSLAETLSIAIQLTDILHRVHQHGVIHKDIKPANILVHPESRQVKLIDFSIASLLPKETQVIQSPKSLEGTLAYIAPEQTGRMNRAIDYRTDFYALGVTFYQLLTGQLPFTKDDPLALIHCHIAQLPVAADQVNPNVPTVVAAIVAKLMAKNAEDRYQSAPGLKYDLAQCLNQWKEQGEIKTFTLGQRDLSARFTIPEKLYGRETEVQTLLDGFERVSQGSSELMLVAGFSGIGKTAVVNEIHKPIVRQRGYFIKGKFDQFNHNIPLSAFVDALRDLMGQLLSESDQVLATWKANILDVVGDNGQVLIEVIPELERVIGPQPAAPDLSGVAAQNRFNLLFQAFIAIFTTPEHPLVMFLDDLQWADPASLNLITVLMGESKTNYLLLLGAYRDNEVFPTHPLMLTLGELKKQAAAISTITLIPLSPPQINQLVMETLSYSADLAEPLTDLVYQKTQGNPFFTTQFLQGLYKDKLVVFNPDQGSWDYDLVEVQNAVLTDDVVDFMADRLRKLSPATQTALKLAACIGNQFDLATLAIVSEATVETVAADLWPALRDCLIIPITEAYKFFQGRDDDEQYATDVVVGYRFLHDRVQQASYGLIPESEKKSTHIKIGKLLLSQSDPTRLEEIIFSVVGQLNMGLELLETQEEKLKLAHLNLVAGKKAKVSTAYASAIDYCQTAIGLLPANRWESQYALTLDISVELLESEYLNTNFDVIEELADSILKQTQTLLDTIKVYEIKIRTWIGRGDQHQALKVGLDVLNLLDIPLRDTQPETVSDVPGLLNAPAMGDPNKLAAMKIMEFIITPAWAVSPEDFQKIAFTMVDLSIHCGNCAESAFGYTWYATILCSSLEDIDAGYEFGQLAIALLDRFPAEELQAKVLILNATCVGFWKKHVREFLPAHLRGLHSGLANGEIEYACYGAAEYAQYIFLIGFPLDIVRDESQEKLEIIQHCKQDFHVEYMVPCLQGALNLLGEGDSQRKLNGPAYREDDRLPTLFDEQQLTLIFIIYFVKSLLSYILSDSLQAVEEGAIARKNSAGVTGTLFMPLELFYSSLARVDCLDKWPQDKADAEKKDILDCLDKLKYWAQYAPMNYQHRCDLIEAELASYSQQFMKAMDLYDRAIANAKTNQYLQDEAIGNECAAKFYLRLDKQNIAAIYMQEAYYCYARWGAKVKVADLETRYPELLHSILQSSAKSTDMLYTLKSLYGKTTSVSKHDASNNTDLNQTLDFASILKASQTLSSTIQLDELLHQLTQIILQNSGGDGCALILSDETGELRVRAITTTKNTDLYAEPLVNNLKVPVKLIQYVKNTQEPIFINDLETDLPVIDDYLTQHEPKSILCLPLLHQRNLIGILYLKNDFTSGVFTQDRILVLNLLCSQAAISIENASLYQTLELKVEQRTAELSQTLEHLQSTQKQLVESEKMASLGGLVAGVAHEINTPVGTSLTLASTLADEIQIFTEQVSQGQLKRSILTNFLTVAEDSSQLMLSNLQRAGDLIQSFKKIAVDQENLGIRQFNLKRYIEEIALSLAPELKPTPHQLIVTGEDLLMIDSYPGALAQVVTNLVMNSINHGYRDSQPGKLMWQIQAGAQQVILTYQDDGCGITAENLTKIFEPFFTTARHRGGTGLGLHIVYNLVTQTLQGTIEVESQLGKGVCFVITLPQSLN